MHFNTLIISLAAFAATSAAPLDIRQKPNPVQISITTYGNAHCQDQIFNGFPQHYNVLLKDMHTCRTFYQGKNYPVGSISAEFTPEATKSDSCVITLYSDTECKQFAGVADINGLADTNTCTSQLIAENVCPRPTGPKSFIYNC